MSENRIVDMKVIPVAGYDSMLFTLSGVHSPYFTRNLVILEDSKGRIGVGEVHGGEKIRLFLENSKEHVVGELVADYRKIINDVRSNQLEKENEGIQFLDIAKLSNVVQGETAIEAACLDLLGKELNLPICSLLGEGRQRQEIDVLGYMFFVGDKDKTDLPYLDESESKDPWFNLRRMEMLDSSSIIKQASALIDKYGFKNLKLKGGVLKGIDEMQIIADLKIKFPEIILNIDPNGAWTLEEALHLTEKYGLNVSYMEDPCLGENGYSGREILSEYKVATGMRVATNMIATNWRQLNHALSQKSIDIVLADPHFWTMEGSVRVSQLLDSFGLTWGSHSNNHFDISLAMFVHTAAAAKGKITPMDTHWIWQDGQDLCKNAHKIIDGKITVTDSPGLGIELDMDKVMAANKLYLELDDKFKDRDDSLGMQYLIPGWTYNNKKPCLMR